VAQRAQAAGDVHAVSFNRGDVLGDGHAVDEPVAAAGDHRPEGLGAGAVAVPGAREAHAGQVERVAEPCPVAQPQGALPSPGPNSATTCGSGGMPARTVITKCFIRTS
jgi:hypothetical protein